MFWYCFRERETILDLFEMSSGQRMHTRYIQVGGVIEDIPAGFGERRCARSARSCPTASTSTATCSRQNEIVLQRLRGVVPARRADAARRSASPARCCARPATRGTCARRCRTRPTRTSTSRSRSARSGDNYDRFFVRIAEMKESVKIIEPGARRAARGPHITEDRKVALPPRHELATSMEALIHHFKLVTEGFRVPPGEVYYPIEAPRGELGCFVRSDGSSKPARVHMRDPSFVNLQATAPMVRGRLHRRPHRDARDARPDPRRDRPVMAIDPTRVPRFGHGSRVPGWDEAADLAKDPASVPDPATTPVPDVAARRGSRRTWRSTPTSARPPSRRSTRSRTTTAGARRRASSRRRA